MMTDCRNGATLLVAADVSQIASALLQQLRGEYTGKRNALMKGWTSAKDSRSKAKARADIPKWHASLRPQSRIAMAQLQQAMKRDSDPTKKYMGEFQQANAVHRRKGPGAVSLIRRRWGMERCGVDQIGEFSRSCLCLFL
jgi:hypothetical protein